MLLTFLAGAELDPVVIRTKIKEVSLIGLVGFVAPFAGGTAVARFLLGWSIPSSFLGGIALSTTSMAVVYAVMLETGLNRTEFGKGILGACFVNDLGTVIALGLMFSPFTYKTIVFIGVSAVVIASLPTVTKFLTKIYGNRTAAIRTKWIIAILLGLGTLAYWSGSEAVLPAYVVGIVLAEFATAEHQWLRRLRTLTTGFLTPFYFIRAGSFVSVPALIAAPAAFLLLFLAKVLSKIFGLYPLISRFRQQKQERWYYTLMMSTGLTFGTISALYGFTHGIISQAQYSAARCHRHCERRHTDIHRRPGIPAQAPACAGRAQEARAENTRRQSGRRIAPCRCFTRGASTLLGSRLSSPKPSYRGLGERGGHGEREMGTVCIDLQIAPLGSYVCYSRTGKDE